MTWRLSVVHQTQYNYESEVTASFNEARMTPLTTTHQLLVHHSLTVIPAPSIFGYQDYFGTTVESFDLQYPHTSLDIVSENIVDTSVVVPGLGNMRWADIRSTKVRNAYAQYLSHTDLVDPIISDVDLSSEMSPYAAVDLLNSSMLERITYWPGATNVYTKASQAWAEGKGVCQDFTHASISLLRSAGIPARYVSGYLYNGEGDIGETVIGESHSWVEAWIGYWHAFDPTNGREVGEDHVIVARGRDYHDVTPLKGIFTGGRSRKVKVLVSVTRLPR
ncbi:MAG: transglutaminase family protein [Actinomycetota bacterium]